VLINVYVAVEIAVTINDRLAKEARKLGNHRTRKRRDYRGSEGVRCASQPAGDLSLFGRTDYDERYDYERERQRGSSLPAIEHQLRSVCLGSFGYALHRLAHRAEPNAWNGADWYYASGWWSLGGSGLSDTGATGNGDVEPELPAQFPAGCVIVVVTIAKPERAWADVSNWKGVVL
jgi:hypothetical protein